MKLVQFTKKMKFTLNYITYTKITWKYNMNLDVRCKTIKTFGEKKKTNKPGLSNKFLAFTPKAQS